MKLQTRRLPPPAGSRPPHWSQDCGIARRRKLCLGPEVERGAMVQEDLFVGPPMKCRGEVATANLQAESYFEREHNTRRAALGAAHATRGITANVIDITLLPQHSRARPAQSIPTRCAGQRGWNNGNRVPITISGFTKQQYTGVTQMLDLDAMPQEGMIYYCTGQASGGWRVFDIWDLQGHLLPESSGRYGTERSTCQQRFQRSSQFQIGTPSYLL